MSKKHLLTVAFAALAFGFAAQAQTNLQTFYDFGKDRDHFTTTLEGFYNDNWGNTFFFIDYDYNAKNEKKVNQAPSSSYMEIARCLNFWQDTPLAPISLQVEYNGLVGVNQNFLFGVDWFFPLQFTFVWGMQDLFGVKGLRFSGFADIWGENVVNFMEGGDKSRKFVFISEPQLWYNIGQHMGIPNLHIGTEVELTVNFAGYDGFYARPCIGTKWVF